MSKITTLEKLRVHKILRELGFSDIRFDHCVEWYYNVESGNDIIFAPKALVEIDKEGYEYIKLDNPDVAAYPKDDDKPFVINIYDDDSETDVQRDEIYKLANCTQIKLFRNKVGTVQQLWYDAIKRELKVKCIL